MVTGAIHVDIRHAPAQVYFNPKNGATIANALLKRYLHHMHYAIESFSIRDSGRPQTG
jgi:hypothetical protein